MSLGLRILLAVGAVLLVVLVLKRIRRATINVGDSIFWVLMSVVILILAIFPGIAICLGDLIGVESPSNLVFLVFIGILLVKLFMTDMELSKAKNKIDVLIEQLAVQQHDTQQHESSEQQ